GDQRLFTEDHAGRRAREAGEEKPRRHRETQEPGQGLEGHHDIGRQPGRRDLAVADRREGLDAEEERPEKAVPRDAVERMRAQAVVDRSENEVGGQVARSEKPEEAWPGKSEERMVEIGELDPALGDPPDVELPVALEKPVVFASAEAHPAKIARL